jgi:hypothetical protein
LVTTSAERHCHAADSHEGAPARHEEAALFRLRRGDQVRADLEQRNAPIVLRVLSDSGIDPLIDVSPSLTEAMRR